MDGELHNAMYMFYAPMYFLILKVYYTDVHVHISTENVKSK